MVPNIEPDPLTGNLTESEINALGRYNGERARGIVHTEAWAARMARLQQRYELELEREMARRGGVRLGGAWLVPRPRKRRRWFRWFG